MKYSEIINSLIENADKPYTKPDKVVDPNQRTNMLKLRDSMRDSVKLFEQLVEKSLKRIPNTKLVFSNPSGTRFLDGSAAKIRNYLWIQLKEEQWKENSISISIFATKEFFRITTEFVDKDVTTEEKDKYNKIFDTPLNASEFDYFFPKENRYCTYNEVIEKNKEYKFQISKSIKKNEILSDEQLEAKIAESILFLTPIYQGILTGNAPIVENINPQNLTKNSANQPQDKQGTVVMQKNFFGAPGTGKSYKINSLLPNESVWNLTGEERKSLFVRSDVAKKIHYAEVLDDEAKFGGNIWEIDDSSLLEKNLSDVDSEDNVSHPEHSALQAYINFLKEYKFDQKVFRTTFHPDYDYAQFVGAYKPLKTHNSSTLTKNELIDRLKEMKKIDSYPVHKFSALYFDSLLKLSNAELMEIIKETDTPDSMNVELKKGIAVGEYLKSKRSSSSITYSFVPQVFAKAYATAWKLYLQRDSRLRGNDDKNGENDSGKDIQVYLVIEEINRGNCAQIFGDIFQLLDRDGKGFSQYSIDADCDFATWLKEDSFLKTVWNDYETKVGDGKLKLPPNLNILATMNTSDQSLFPMDSAFKRRFDWEYVPIKYAKDSDCGEDWNADKFTIDGNGLTFKWLDFLKKVNADIYKVTESEDKQMGEFFIKPKRDDMKITLDEFRSKVLFYLWDSVYKDEHDSKLVFHFPYPEKGSDVTFQRLFSGDFVEILKQMLKNLDETYKDGEFKDLKILEE